MYSLSLLFCQSSLNTVSSTVYFTSLKCACYLHSFPIPFSYFRFFSFELLSVIGRRLYLLFQHYKLLMSLRIKGRGCYEKHSLWNFFLYISSNILKWRLTFKRERSVQVFFLSLFLSFFFFFFEKQYYYDRFTVKLRSVMLVAQTRTKNPLTWIANANP